MIVMKRSFSHPIRRITNFNKSARLRSESLIPFPIRVSINQISIQRKSFEFVNQWNLQNSSNHIDVQKVQMRQNLDTKNQEIDNLKQKIIQSLETIKQQDAIIIEWQQKYQEQEKQHNKEIAQLKSNLDNSIFDEPQMDLIEEFNENSYQQKINELQIIQEESECPQIKSLNQSVAQNQKFYEILNALNKMNFDESPQREQFEINEFYIVQRINKLVDYIHKLEIELDDWKCNYWNLEKQLNSILKDNFMQQGSQEIEIEFDFDKNQLAEEIKPNSKRSLQDENCVLQQEIQRLKELNKQLQNQQNKSQTKQVLESLINKQKKSNKKKNLTHIPELSNKHFNLISSHHSRSYNNTSEKSHPTQHGSPNQQRNNQQINQYFSHYFQLKREHTTQHYSPVILRKVQQIDSKQQQLGIKYLKDMSIDHYYNINVYQTPIVVKQSNSSPYQKQGSKFIQF